MLLTPCEERVRGFLYVFSDPCAFVTDIVSILILISFYLIFQTTLRNKFVNLNWIHVLLQLLQ